MALEPFDRINAASLLTDCYLGLEQPAEAEPYALETFHGRKALLGATHEQTREALDRVIRIYESLDKPEKAEIYRRLLAEK